MENHPAFSLGPHKTVPKKIQPGAKNPHAIFAGWAAYGAVQREKAGALLSAEEALREDVESFEEH